MPPKKRGIDRTALEELFFSDAIESHDDLGDANRELERQFLSLNNDDCGDANRDLERQFLSLDSDHEGDANRELERQFFDCDDSIDQPSVVPAGVAHRSPAWSFHLNLRKSELKKARSVGEPIKFSSLANAWSLVARRFGDSVDANELDASAPVAQPWVRRLGTDPYDPRVNN